MVVGVRAAAVDSLGSSSSVSRPRSQGAEDACRVDGLVADALARVIDGEILPRLRLIHRPPAPVQTPVHRPTAEAAERLHALLLAPSPVNLDAEAAVLLGGGVALDTMLLDLLAPAARHLGALWEDDLCDFLAVTEGLGRLQALTRRLCAGLETGAPRAGRAVLLLPCPGETHLYALSIVASFFREAGWDATVLDRAGPGAADLLRGAWFDAVGLSLSCDVHLDALRTAVGELRRASRNPALAVVVGGPWFARHDADARAVGADACAVDGASAPRVAEALLEVRPEEASVAVSA